MKCCENCHSDVACEHCTETTDELENRVEELERIIAEIKEKI